MIPWNKGKIKVYSDKTLDSMRQSAIERSTPEYRKKMRNSVGVGEDNLTWKGDKASYRAIHVTLTNQSGSGWVSSTDNSLVGKNIYEFAIQSGKFQNLLTLSADLTLA